MRKRRQENTRKWFESLRSELNKWEVRQIKHGCPTRARADNCEGKKTNKEAVKLAAVKRKEELQIEAGNDSTRNSAGEPDGDISTQTHLLMLMIGL